MKKDNNILNHPLFRKYKLEEEEYYKEKGRLLAQEHHRKQQEVHKKYERDLAIYKQQLGSRNERLYNSNRSKLFRIIIPLITLIVSIVSFMAGSISGGFLSFLIF